jgi:hypothetical protein
VVLAQREDEEWTLVVAAHHVAWDGWSSGVFLRELLTAYAGEALPAPGVGYGDYALAERLWLESGAADDARRFWGEQLDALPTLDLRGVDYNRPRSGAGGRVPVSIAATASESLWTLARAQEATPFMAALAAWYVALSRHSGQTDIPLGTSVANRRDPALESVIGFFVNQVVLRGDLRGNPSFRSLLDRVRAMCLGAFEHEAYPFSALVSERRAALPPQRSPLYQSMFVLQSAGEPVVLADGLRVVPEASDAEHSKFELSLFLTIERQGLLSGALVYDVALIGAARGEALARDYERVVTLAVAEPDAPLSRLLDRMGEEREPEAAARKFDGLRKVRGSAMAG